MSQKLKTHTCPECGMVGSLEIEVMLIAKQLGTHSLSGTQMKVSANTKPVIVCTNNCAFLHVGEFDGDYHAIFTPFGE